MVNRKGYKNGKHLNIFQVIEGIFHFIRLKWKSSLYIVLASFYAVELFPMRCATRLAAVRCWSTPFFLQPFAQHCFASGRSVSGRRCIEIL